VETCGLALSGSRRWPRGGGAVRRPGDAWPVSCRCCSPSRRSSSSVPSCAITARATPSTRRGSGMRACTSCGCSASCSSPAWQTSTWSGCDARARYGTCGCRFPDQHVAWRTRSAPADPPAALTAAVRTVLGL